MSTALKNTQLPLLDVERIRRDFPILARTVHHGKPLIYLDNAATTQKPARVIETLAAYYRNNNSNVHRGVHALSEEATAAYEGARETVRAFINAASSKEIIFTRGTTEAINLVAQSHARSTLKPGDEVLITYLEHHSNIVPWQLVCEQTGASLKVAAMTERGEVDQADFAGKLSDRTRIVALGHVSNALGTINPARQMIAQAHAAGAVTVVDGAQAVPHMAVDVQALDADFYAFSGHKMFAPTGIGVLYGKQALLDAMPPWQGGGDMIRMVSFDQTLYNDLPYKFEAGTPNIAGPIGLAAAIGYLQDIGLEAIAAYEQELLAYASQALAALPDIRIIGAATHKAAVISFVMNGIHPHDLGTIVDSEGVAIRTGHHCAMPVMDFFQVPATARASLAFYNTREEINRLVAALDKARQVFS